MHLLKCIYLFIVVFLKRKKVGGLHLLLGYRAQEMFILSNCFTCLLQTSEWSTSVKSELYLAAFA